MSSCAYVWHTAFLVDSFHTYIKFVKESTEFESYQVKIEGRAYAIFYSKDEEIVKYKMFCIIKTSTLSWAL